MTATRLHLGQLDQGGATAGQALVWDNTLLKWVPGTVSGGGGGGGGSVAGTSVTDRYTATAGQTAFTLSATKSGGVMVFRNGLMLNGATDYTTTSTTVTLTTGATVGDAIAIIYGTGSGLGGGLSVTAIGSGAGDYGGTSTTMIDVDAALSASIPAGVGDVLICTFVCAMYTGGSTGFAEVGLNIGGTLRRSTGITLGGAAVPTTVHVRYVVQAGDVSSGSVIVKPQWKRAASTLAMINDTTDRRPTLVVVNTSASAVSTTVAEDGVALNGADDYGFGAITSLDTVPSPWAFVRAGAGANQLHYQEGDGRGVLKQEGAYTYMQGIERALPAGFATALFRMSAIPGTGNEGFGPWLSAGSGGKMCHFTLRAAGGSNLTFFSSPTVTVGTDLTAHVWQPGPTTNWYFKIIKNSSSSWDFLFGPSPTLLSTFFAAVNVPTATQGFTPVNIGFGFLCLGGGMKIAAIDYVKFT